MLPDRPDFSEEEKIALVNLYKNGNFTDMTKWIIDNLTFGSDELFNVLTPFKYLTPNGEWEYLRSVFDIKKEMKIKKDNKIVVVDYEFSHIDRLVIDRLSNYYKKIRDAIREEKHADIAFIHLSKKDLNMMNKQARELVQNLIDEVING
jgi:hypothetical protein